MSAVPETRYAKSGDVHIAYQVLGAGPRDLVFVPGFVSNVEAVWEFPEFANFLRRLASFCRVIIFDKRGTGMSDHGSQLLRDHGEKLGGIAVHIGSRVAGKAAPGEWRLYAFVN